MPPPLVDQLHKLYYDYGSPSALSRPDVLYKFAKQNKLNVTKKAVLEYLSTQDAHTLHRPVIRRFPRNRVVVNKIDDVWMLDLADVGNIASYNDGFRYILVAIDVLSKVLFVEPVRNKESRTVASAFDTILTRSWPRIPNMVCTDKGTEFTGRNFQNFLNDNQIGFYTTENEDIKACIAERVIRTLKGRMWRYFTARNTRRYINVLDDLVTGYNNTTHRSIGMAPSSVSEQNEKKVWNTLYGTTFVKSVKKQFKIGDKVRISRATERFRRGFEEGWTREIFEIVRKIGRKPYPVYVIKDLAGETLRGTFYPHELGLVTQSPDTLYQVEKILKTRKRKGKLEYFCKFKGYENPKFNAWVTDLEHVG